MTKKKAELGTLKPGQTMTMTFTANYPYELRVKKRWRYGDAKEYVWYELWEEVTTWRGKRKWKQATERVCYESGCYQSPLSGDLDWAKRTAKRFNLKVPK